LSFSDTFAIFSGNCGFSENVFVFWQLLLAIVALEQQSSSRQGAIVADLTFNAKLWSDAMIATLSQSIATITVVVARLGVFQITVADRFVDMLQNVKHIIKYFGASIVFYDSTLD
jgi:hypothetical protein